ncbi:hypothetical protein LEP1GSC163_3226 [Leptospira santarosai str. CBC379]|nr:hypothetical protein LEP1GSC163_3226 [Leptospira santarosai str. CBC379]
MNNREIKGPAWFLCLEKLQSIWQKIESSQASVPISIGD